MRGGASEKATFIALISIGTAVCDDWFPRLIQFKTHCIAMGVSRNIGRARLSGIYNEFPILPLEDIESALSRAVYSGAIPK